MNIYIKLNARKFLGLSVLSTALLLSIYVYLSPYIALFYFKSAFDNQDYIEARKYINFSKLRQSVKPQISRQFNYTIQRHNNLIPYQKLGELFLVPIINRIVDSVVSPRGLNLLIRRGILSQSTDTGTSNSFNSPNLQNKNPSSDIEAAPALNLYYESPNIFVLTSHYKHLENPIKAFWIRKGLVHWELQSVHIPDQLIHQIKF